MKIAIDSSPLFNPQHKVRGSGFYLHYLKSSLETYFPENEYLFFKQGEHIPKNFDVIHYPFFDPFFHTLTPFSSHKRVVTVHDLTPFVLPTKFPIGLKGKINWQLQKFSLKRVNGVITDSQSSKQDIARFTGVHKDAIHCVYLAAANDFIRLPAGKWRDEIKQKYKLPNSFVLYVGDATNNKNLVRLVQAIKKVKLPLVMIGKVLAQEFSENNGWLSDQKNVILLTKDDPAFIRLGFVPTEDLVKIYNIATVFAMPSLYEGFGLPILEAMQSGAPVVTTKCGSLKEIAGDAAVFADPYSTEDIANAIVRLFDNNTMQESYRKKGLAQASKFTWKNTAEQTIAIYKKALQ